MRRDIIGFFEKGIFPYKGNVFKTKDEKSEEELEEKIEKSTNDGIIFIEEKSRDINNDLFKKYFNFSAPIVWAKNYLKQKIKIKTVSL